MSVDEDGFIKSTDYTAGNVHDSNCFTDLLSGNETSVYADSAYQSQAHGTWLAERHIENRIIKRAYRNKPLNKEAKQFNRIHSGVRCTVERVFGVLKQHYGMAKGRYLGLNRNRTRFELMCVAHNLKRGLSIQQASFAIKNGNRGKNRPMTMNLRQIGLFSHFFVKKRALIKCEAK